MPDKPIPAQEQDQVPRRFTTRARPPRRQLCWDYVWGALLVLAVLWGLAHVRRSVSWDEVMNWLGVTDKVRYTQVFCLGLFVTAWCAIARILKDKGSR